MYVYECDDGLFKIYINHELFLFTTQTLSYLQTNCCHLRNMHMTKFVQCQLYKIISSYQYQAFYMKKEDKKHDYYS